MQKCACNSLHPRYLKLQVIDVEATGPGIAAAAEYGGLLFATKSGFDEMTEHSLWRFSRAFHRAINERRFEDLETMIDEDVGSFPSDGFIARIRLLL